MNLAGGRLTKKLKKGVLRTSQAYELGDTFFRVQMFYLERARYKKADPNTTDEQVAELVNEIYQDYSRSPNALKSLRRNAAFAPFVSFHYEILRTSVATVKQIKHELRHENRAVKKIGAQRLAGFSLIAGAGSAAFARVMQYMFGIPESIMDALRDHSAPWDKNSTLVPVDIFRGGGRYINSTYTDPYEVIKEPFKMFVQGALSEDQFLEKSYQAMLKAFEPALSPELYTKAVAEAALNRRNLEDPNSSRIYNPEDSGVDKVMSRLAHVWDAVEPGFLKQGGQIIEALGDEEDAPGALEAFSALMGQRIVKIDTQETLPFKARDYSTTVRNLRSSYTKKVREGELSLLEEARELNRINQRKLEEFQKVEKSIETAFRLGLDWEEIKEALVQGGMSGVEAERIWNGEFVPFEYLEEEE